VNTNSAATATIAIASVRARGTTPRSFACALTLVVLALPGCTWVKVTDAGAKVAIRNASEVTACRKVGVASAHTTAKVLLARDSRTVQAEVLALAKNQAGEMHGNAIVPIGDVQNGAQTFDVYSCP
jgi:hypothetical protein